MRASSRRSAASMTSPLLARWRLRSICVVTRARRSERSAPITSRWSTARRNATTSFSPTAVRSAPSSTSHAAATQTGASATSCCPFSTTTRADFANPDPADWPWRDYRSDLWYDAGGRCASSARQCGIVRQQLRRLSLHGLSARWERCRRLVCAAPLVDPNGAFDYDGDGKPELINTGCEACHGPGSEHLELTAPGAATSFRRGS